MTNIIMLFIILFCIFLFIKMLLLKQKPSDTPAGAIIMACGIFINGAMHKIPLLEKNAGKSFTIMLFLLWLFIGASYARSALQGKLEERHLRNPIKSFAIGTWVAGTSVTGIAIFQRLQGFTFLAKSLFYFNLLLWFFYLTVCYTGYRRIIQEHLYNKVHGVLLLSTVSTQSIVVLGATIYGKDFPPIISQLLISLGSIFYTVAFILILRRYFFQRGWSIADDWQNTNCILHGAMSITGLASVVSGAVQNNIILFIWLWILLWFVIVEIIEILRALKRMEKYGFRKGIAVYDVTQWSRIFTFGMLYTFTMKFNLKLPTLSNAFFLNVQHFILKAGTWVMVLILLIEGTLFFVYESKNGMS